jgi:hypothetical protein
MREDAFLYQLPAADDDAFLHVRTRAERAILLVFTLLIWASISLLLVFVIAVWSGPTR